MADVALCLKLTEAVAAGNSPLIQKIFEALVNDDEASILLAAAPPATAKELSRKTGFPEPMINATLESLFNRGLIFMTRKGEEVKYYRVRSIPQMHDSTVLTPGVSREVLDLWKEYVEKEWPDYGRKILDLLPGSIMRVIAVNESIEPQSRILAHDDVVQLIENARTLSVTKCSCRVIDGSCKKPLEVCIQVDRAAEYSLERGTGKAVSRNEAIELLKMCEKEGLVHTVENRQALGHVICNCCRDCCMNWSVMTGPKRWVVPSRFTAVVDPDLCTGCETCLERCFFDALAVNNDLAAVNPEKCMGCGVCTVSCPTEALRLKEVRPADFVPV